MKLSKQERIGALIILAIVILALGAFLLVKPKIESALSTGSTLLSKQEDLRQKKEKAARKGQLRTDIEAAYQEGEHLADMFFPELAAYEADNAFRAFVKQCNLPIVVEQVSVSEPDVTDLAVSFYVPSEVTYALKTYVSQGAVNVDDFDLDNARRTLALAMAVAETQTVGASNVEFTVSALNQEDILKFVDAVNDYFIKEGESTSEDDKGIRKAVKVSSLNLPYEEVNDIYDKYLDINDDAMEAAGDAAIAEIAAKKLNPEAQQTIGEASEELTIQTIEPYVMEHPVSYSDSFTFLSIERMQNPKAILDEQDGIAADTPAA